VRLLSWALRALWFVLIPLLGSGIVWRYLLPHSSSALPAQGALRGFAERQGLLLALLVFLLFASLLRYWRTWLPGGRYLSPLPNELVAHAPRRRLRDALVFGALLGVVTVAAWQMRARYLQAYDVLGPSMLPTLTPGEVLAAGIISSMPGQLPQRGDVIVLQSLVDGAPHEVIKRVIGLPGDRIAMNGVHPIINGWAVPLCEVGPYYSPYNPEPTGLLVMEFLDAEAYLTLQSTVAAPVAEYVVKVDEIFVLGDNRSNSRDSRSFDRGAPHGLPLSDVRARVARVLFRPTAHGDIDWSSALKPLGPSVFLDGADLSGIQARIASCLAARPKTTSPPRSASAALARHD